MDYKLLAIDVDGTLLNSKHEISKRTRDSLLKAQQMGVRIALISGRPTFGLKAIAQTLQLQKYGGFIVAYNGSKIIDAGSGKILFEKYVNPEILPYLEKKAREYKFPIFTYKEDKLITNNPHNPHIRHEAEINGLGIVYEQEFSICIDFEPCKVVLVSDDTEAIEGLYGRWKLRMDGTVEVHRSEDFFLEALPVGVDKSMALSFLISHLGIKSDEVVAFGNGVRDVGMLQLAGQSVAMGNAVESVRSCSDIITDTNDNDGIAQIIDSYITGYHKPDQQTLEDINRHMENSMISYLGISITFTSDSRIEATMPVNINTRQPFGILHGGATLTLAETVAGLGSMLIINPDEISVGMQVSGNHVSSAHEGDTVRAVASLIHKGRTSHVWNVDVFTSTGKLVSTVRVANSIRQR